MPKLLAIVVVAIGTLAALRHWTHSSAPGNEENVVAVDDEEAPLNVVAVEAGEARIDAPAPLNEEVRIAQICASLTQLNPELEKLKTEHWAWQPLCSPKAPAVKDEDWPKDDIDRFILAKLEAKNVYPVGDADKSTLLRRITFDLIGLPPTPADIDDFVLDPSADAFVRVVDRLLESRQYGERWGRHWLDLARYGESTGSTRNVPLPFAWRYRDYVIDAVSSDIPFDRFVQEQIAGDLLPAASDAERDRLLTATGFLALGAKELNEPLKVRFVMDNVDEQIDTVSRSILALTVGCARCHDHKFDPIATADYYALAGIFTSTDNCAGLRNMMGGSGLSFYDASMLVPLTTKLPPPPAKEVALRAAKLEAAKKEWEAVRGTPEGQKAGPLGLTKERQLEIKYEEAQFEYAAVVEPVGRGHAVHGAREAKEIGDTQIRIRGEAEKIGPSVPRGFLSAIEVPGAAKVNRKQSGRLELAQWLTSPKNPLTPRVFVNRVWQHLFGQGLVASVDNFGVTGARPSHPELLDHLANRFIAEGWSVKKLVRAIVLTRAYQLSSVSEPRSPHSEDPANCLVWRHSPRRLAAEEIRDATLAVAGTLDANRPFASATKELPMVEMVNDGPEARVISGKADSATYRSIYLPLLRIMVPRSLEAFDPVNQLTTTGNRDVTTVPGQALYSLNSLFIQRQALKFAERLLGDKGASTAVRIDRAYLLALGRKPEKEEIEWARSFLADYETEYRSDAAALPSLDEDEDEDLPLDAATAAWVAFAQALLGSAEFRLIR